MKRSATLRRRTPLRPTRERLRHIEARALTARDDGKRDEAYLAWLRRQPCALDGVWAHWRHVGVQAHHATAGRGLGQKTHDHTAVPLCITCHAAFHGAREPFDMGKEGRAQWMAAQAVIYRTRYAARGLA